MNLLENGQGGASLRVIQALGSLYERTGRPKKARALYEKYMARNPDSVLLGDAFKRLDKGLPVRPMVATAEEGLAEALFNLASTPQQQSVGRLALNYARLALILRPDFPVDQTLLADIFDGLGRDREAIAIYETIDPKSAFGSIIGFNRVVDLETAKAIRKGFVEVVCAPGFEDDALKQLKRSKNMRIIEFEAENLEHTPEMLEEMARNRVTMKMSPLVAQGMLVYADGEYTMNMSFESGKLELNGQEIPIAALMSGMQGGGQ